MKEAKMIFNILAQKWLKWFIKKNKTFDSLNNCLIVSAVLQTQLTANKLGHYLLNSLSVTVQKPIQQ